MRLPISLVKAVLLRSTMLKPLKAKAGKTLLQGAVLTRHCKAKLLVVEAVGVEAAGNKCSKLFHLLIHDYLPLPWGLVLASGTPVK
jgi:hypothetical protein